MKPWYLIINPSSYVPLEYLMYNILGGIQSGIITEYKRSIHCVSDSFDVMTSFAYPYGINYCIFGGPFVGQYLQYNFFQMITGHNSLPDRTVSAYTIRRLVLSLISTLF